MKIRQDARLRGNDEMKSSAAEVIALFIGPEGGWSPRDVELAKSAGCHPASLGPRVLRAETAPIAAAAMVHACLTLLSET